MSTSVEYRLKEIRQYTDIDFRHVAPDANHADIARCGMHSNELYLLRKMFSLKVNNPFKISSSISFTVSGPEILSSVDKP
jgi:hypothetical protein